MPRRTMLLVAALTVALGLSGAALSKNKPGKPPHKPTGPAHHTYAWHDVTTGSTASLRGLSAVSRNVAWASGSAGTVLRTTDRGATWQSVGPPGAGALQFRDIEAFGPNRAVIMAAGTGTDSQIYRTTDGGATWTLVYQNTEPNAFFDCMTFFNRKVGLTLSDPPDGVHFRILKTTDNGRTWNIVDPAGMPPALAFRSQQHGLAVGGDFAAPATSPDNFAKTNDGGHSWSLLTGAPTEYRSGVTTAIAVGLTGSDFTRNKGLTWTRFDDGSFHTVDCANPNACWASGANGRVAYLTR
jgi:hypothetical protein